MVAPPASAQDQPADQQAAPDEAATGAAATPTRVGLLPNLTPKWLTDALTRHQPVVEAHTLEVAGSKFLTLLQPAQQPVSEGLVVLLPDRGQHPDWPQHVRPLRNHLSEHGWTVLSLSLPIPMPASPPPRPMAPEPEPDAEENNAEENNNEQNKVERPAQVNAPPEPPPAAQAATPETAPAPASPPPTLPSAELFQQLSIQALALVAGGTDNRVVLIGMGDGGYWASRWTSDLLAQYPDIDVQLVLVDAHNNLPGVDEPLTDYLLQPIVILDLTSRHSEGARLRRLAVQRAGVADYRQQQLPSGDSERRLVNRIRGFIE